MNERDRAASALHHLDAGCPREDWVKVGMSAKAAGLGFDDFNNWSATAGNYASESECRAVWKSFDESGGVTPATLFGMAFAQGWKDPSKTRTKASNAICPSQPIAKPTTTQPKAVKSPQGMNPVEVWRRCIPADAADGYIFKKRGTPDGLRIYPTSAPPLVIRGQNVAGYLAVPCWDGADLQTIQFIPPAGGDKLNLTGAQFNNGFFTVGEIADRVFIVEGIGQAWACNGATGAAAVVCFGVGRMNAVASALRAEYPAARLVLVPDRGKEAQAEAIAAARAEMKRLGLPASALRFEVATPDNLDGTAISAVEFCNGEAA